MANYHSNHQIVYSTRTLKSWNQVNSKERFMTPVCNKSIIFLQNLREIIYFIKHNFNSIFN